MCNISNTVIVSCYTIKTVNYEKTQKRPRKATYISDEEIDKLESVVSIVCVEPIRGISTVSTDRWSTLGAKHLTERNLYT